MKQRVLALALCVTVLLGLCPAALAAAKDSGFYKIGAAQGVTVRPVTLAGDTVSGVSRDVDGDGADEVFYPGSEALAITLADTAPGELYLLTVSSPEKVWYADQLVGGGTLRFRAAFSLPDRRTALKIEIGSSKAGFSRITVPVSYTPSASGVRPTMKQGYAACGKASACPMSAFADMAPTAWYHDGVHFALENGIMVGVGEKLFRPRLSASRAMIVTMLWRLEGSPEARHAGFRDVLPGAWYAKAVSWAASEQIVDGYGDGRFGPNDSISREQLAVILWRYAKYKDRDLPGGKPVNLGIFLDAERIAPWALEGMQWAVNAGLISGTDPERLSPKADATRAQVATLLMRFFRLS